ncbi:DUF692 domain-containing protein [Nostoc sp. LPT]|uniref:DUF692 domain-containing protein n=1 Tax=Nostoc sp. LPT TaxID=2815387 RepID=UPI001D94F8C1|nr:DUF692 domain-containing protein [Nostoc sp. LPT]MBN4007041.1 DUF692 domain-containing protein [Nostoc sp. LPT]
MPKTGLAFRRHINKSQILDFQDSFDCLEFLVESYSALSDPQLKELRNLSNLFTLIPHGLSLSIGSVERPPQSYFDTIARLLEITQPTYYSEHFAFTQTTEKSIDALSPLWYTDELLDVVITNVTSIQRFLGLPLILENIAHPFNIPFNTISQEDFIASVCHETNCGILLDVTNIYIDSKNFGTDPKAFISRLPKSSIKQLHVAGYLEKNGFLTDTHSSAITPEIWEIYDYVISVCTPDYVIIEREFNFPPIIEIITEVERARKPVINYELS